MCTALEGDLVHLVELNEVNCRDVYRAHVASTNWSSTNKLLTHPRIRAFTSLGRSYTINKARAMAMTTFFRLWPAQRPVERCRGVIVQCLVPSRRAQATRRLRALIFFTDRELTAMMSKRLTTRPAARSKRPQPSSFVGRAKASNLVNMVPKEVRSTIPLATQPWEHYKRRGYAVTPCLVRLMGRARRTTGNQGHTRGSSLRPDHHLTCISYTEDGDMGVHSH
jgi:hypothetical protein